jgi:hypothetical protein
MFIHLNCPCKIRCAGRPMMPKAAISEPGAVTL